MCSSCAVDGLCTATSYATLSYVSRVGIQCTSIGLDLLRCISQSIIAHRHPTADGELCDARYDVESNQI